MGKLLVTIYDRLADAENARNALLAEGFSAEELHLGAHEDEAGPQQGNFVLNYKDAEHGDDRSVFDSLLTRDDPNEGAGRTPVDWQAELTLTVKARDEQQCRRAADIARHFGAVAVREPG